jgi:hypothetical protein
MATMPERREESLVVYYIVNRVLHCKSCINEEGI